MVCWVGGSSPDTGNDFLTHRPGSKCREVVSPREPWIARKQNKKKLQTSRPWSSKPWFLKTIIPLSFQKFYRNARRFVDALLIFTATTMLYEGYHIFVPYFFVQDWTSCVAKVFFISCSGQDGKNFLVKKFQHWFLPFFLFFQVGLAFVFFQVIVNWMCVRYYTSEYIRKASDFQPSPMEGHTLQLTENTKLLHNGEEMNPKWYYFLDREIYALSWKWCVFCKDSCPPRAHHCKVCFLSRLTRTNWILSLSSDVQLMRLLHFRYAMLAFWGETITASWQTPALDSPIRDSSLFYVSTWHLRVAEPWSLDWCCCITSTMQLHPW